MATYSYPLNHPVSPGIRNVTWRMHRAAAVMESPFTGSQQVLEWDYALWEAVVELPPMKREQAAEWQAFFMKMRGRVGTFLLADPDAKEPRGAVTGNGLISADASVGDDQVLIDVGQSNLSNALRTGDYVQIGEGSSAQLHMVISDTNSNTSGIVIADIEPRIKQEALTGTAVVMQEPKAVFRLDESVQGWDADQASLYGFSFSCKEAF